MKGEILMRSNGNDGNIILDKANKRNRFCGEKLLLKWKNGEMHKTF